jgi:hypothetical protein
MNTDKLAALAISDSGFIFDPVTGHSFTSNETGISIINHLKQGLSVDEVVDELLEIYDVDENQLEVDVLDFIQNLKNYNLL